MNETFADDRVLLLPLRANIVVVSGLIWQPLTTLKAQHSEAKQLIKKEKCDYFVMHRSGNRAQCGMLASLPSNTNYYSIALMLIDKLGSDWLAIFKLADNRYLLLGIEGGQVVPGCDAIFSNSVEVVENFNIYNSLFSWKNIYAPPSLGLGGESLDLQETLKSITPKPPHRILYTHEINKQSKKLGVKIGVLSLATVVAMSGWYHYQRKQREQEAMQIVRLREEAQTKKVDSVVAAWRQTPPASKFLGHCVRAITRYPITLGGWQVVGVFCEQSKTKALYQRRPPATVNTFITAVTPRYGKSYHFLKDSETARIDQTIAINGDRSQEKLQPIMELASSIVSKMQAGKASGKIEDVLTGGKKSAHYELISQISPLVLFQDISLDGVVIDNLTATMTTEGILSWKISGVIYGE